MQQLQIFKINNTESSLTPKLFIIDDNLYPNVIRICYICFLYITAKFSQIVCNISNNTLSAFIYNIHLSNFHLNQFPLQLYIIFYLQPLLNDYRFQIWEQFYCSKFYHHDEEECSYFKSGQKNYHTHHQIYQDVYEQVIHLSHYFKDFINFILTAFYIEYNYRE